MFQCLYFIYYTRDILYGIHTGRLKWNCLGILICYRPLVLHLYWNNGVLNTLPNYLRLET